MIGNAATLRSEEIVTVLQRLQQIFEIKDCYIGSSFKLSQIFIVNIQILNGHRFIRTPCRIDFRCQRRLADCSMIFERIGRIVSRTNDFNIHAFHDGLRTKLRCSELCRTFIVNLTGSLRVQHLINTKDTAQFQVCPVIERIAHCMFKRICPFLKLLIRRFVTRDIFFWNTVGTHRTPFVVIAAQPNLCQVGELIIFGNLLRNQMTMIVNDRHLCSVLMIELLRRLRLQKEIGIKKCFHIMNGIFVLSVMRYGKGC